MSIEVVPGTVVPPGRFRVGMAHGVLNTLQRSAVAEQLGGEAVPQTMRTQMFRRRNAGATGETPDQRIARAVRQPPAPVAVEE